MTPQRCHQFNVLPVSSFYAINWRNWRQFFDEKYTRNVMKLIENSIAVHVWNKNSHGELLRVGANVAYGLLAEQYCPKVYQSCGEYF